MGMKWINEQVHALSDKLIQSTPATFFRKFFFGTIFIPAATSFTALLNLEKIKEFIPFISIPFTQNPNTCYFVFIFILFLICWIVVMIVVASIVFTSGGNLIRYALPTDRLDSLKISNLVSKTKKNISLIGLSLYPFANESWLKILEEKIRNGVTVKVLIFDPNTEFARTRQSSLRKTGHKLSDDIDESIKIFTDFKKSLSRNHAADNDKFELRLYKGNASMSAFIFDDEIRLGLYVENSTGLSAPEIRIANQGGQADIFERVQNHFESVWNKSSIISEKENIDE